MTPALFEAIKPSFIAEQLPSLQSLTDSNAIIDVWWQGEVTKVDLESFLTKLGITYVQEEEFIHITFPDGSEATGEQDHLVVNF